GDEEKRAGAAASGRFGEEAVVAGGERAGDVEGGGRVGGRLDEVDVGAAEDGEADGGDRILVSGLTDDPAQTVLGGRVDGEKEVNLGLALAGEGRREGDGDRGAGAVPAERHRAAAHLRALVAR